MESNRDAPPITHDAAGKTYSRVYLTEAPDYPQLQEWLQENHDILFDEELEIYSSDATCWPKDRDFESFNEHFDVKFCSEVFDTGHSSVKDTEE